MALNKLFNRSNIPNHIKPVVEPILANIISFYNQQTPLIQRILKICGFSCIYLVIRSAYIKLHRKYKQLPPGPVGLPIFGEFLSMATKGYNFYIDIARYNNCKYKICSLPLGSLQCIMINNDKLMKKILNDESVHWRPKNIVIVDIPASIAWHHGGYEWKQRRKNFQTNLMARLNKQFCDKNIKILLNKFLIPKLDGIANKIDNNQNIWHWKGDFQYFTFSIMYYCIFGDYLEKDDVVYNQYLEHFGLALHHIQISILLYVLCGEKIATFLRRHVLGNKVEVFMRKNYKKAKIWALKAHEKYDENSIETYYDYTYNQLSKQYPSNAKYDDIMTEEVLCDFEVAIEGGTDTTAATLEYVFIAAAKYPNIQDQVYSELDAVYDFSSTNIEDINILEDLQSLHKLRAFVFESLRLQPVISYGLLRQIKAENGIEIDVDGNKYILPDGAIVIPNIIGMQVSPKLWENPDEFDINRWLDKDGKFNRKLNPTLMTFEVGQRDCPGGALAQKTLYLVVAILFSKYRFYFDEPEKIKIEKKLDFVLHVHPEIPVKISKR